MDRIDKMIAAAYAQLRTAGVNEASPAFTVLLKCCARAMVLNERGERWSVIGILHDLHKHCGGALEGALYKQCWLRCGRRGSRRARCLCAAGSSGGRGKHEGEGKLDTRTLFRQHRRGDREKWPRNLS